MDNVIKNILLSALVKRVFFCVENEMQPTVLFVAFVCYVLSPKNGGLSTFFNIIIVTSFKAQNV